MADSTFDNLTVNKNLTVNTGIVLTGNMELLGTATIATPSRMQLLSNQGDLYLLFPKGVVVSVGGGGSGNLTVDGKLTVGTIESVGIMQFFGQDLLYIFNKYGVRIAKDQGGNGNLIVDGDVSVKGDVVLENADCSEDFDIIGAESIEPGTVMAIDNEGALRASEQAYDRRVAGVISGAGDFRPGIMLDRQKEKANRLPLALTGKVYCKVDAEYSPIEVGDLLTTSSTIGHAMKVSDHHRSIGAIIGKALRLMESGCGLIPILVALQ